MIADVFYLFLWDNIKLHTVNVSITGFGVLVFSLWTHIFSGVYNLVVKTGMWALELAAPSLSPAGHWREALSWRGRMDLSDLF